MKKTPNLWLTKIFAASLLMVACSNTKEPQKMSIEVKNYLNYARNEVVSVPFEDLKTFLSGKNEAHLRVLDSHGDNQLVQLQDLDDDKVFDELLFLARVDANSESHYKIVLDSTISIPETDAKAYSRFVPERTDDYTWENDKVAFRTYGPTGQKEALEGVPGSTLSSGIDLWLKRTEKTIIDKWYSEHLKEPGYYHIDHGEGYDPYHVGASRGTGGLGVWHNDSLHVSKNFVNHKTLENGPLRTVFELSYEPWSPFGVQEIKRITLDKKSNFSKFEVFLKASDDLPNYAIGITLHNNQGTTKLNPEMGWYSHWETIDKSQVGEGVVIEPSAVDTAFARQSDVKDQSNLLVLAKPTEVLTYYAGFAWNKSGQITDKEDWEKLLNQQSQKIKSPLKVDLKN
ncbi:uncharacterized protein DUF4861 [Flavobacteriaceae bacterium MAR_2009_75]|nr:uncharacterized protein DUF4861 [Flavobacteriaceae bacterium MAR_2009_75]